MTRIKHATGEPRTRHMGQGHIAALDGVRGLAILGVMVSHLFGGNLARMELARTVFAFGVNGVDLFFVLSGFLITGILRDSLGDPAYFRKFYARRVLRIFPLYYGVVLLLIALTRPLDLRWNGVQWSLLLYLQNTHFLFPPLLSFHSSRIDIDHLWSLAVEEQFYLAWPFLVFSVRRPRTLLWLCGAGIVLSFVLRMYALTHGWGFDWTNRNLFCRVDEMLGGAALAVLLRSRFADAVLRWCVPVFFLAIALDYLEKFPQWFWFAKHGGPSWYLAYLTSANFTFSTVIAASLLAWCRRPESAVRRAFEWKPLGILGKYSYGLYVIHLILLPGLNLMLLGPLRAALHNVVLPRLLVGIIGFVVSFVLAYLSFHLYEKQFLRLKRYFDYTPKPAPAPALEQQMS